MSRVNLTPEALRHTAASMATGSGSDVKVVQRTAGHADARMTLNAYADLRLDWLDGVTDAMTLQRPLALGLPITETGPDDPAASRIMTQS